jgi:hypothetical protein
MFAALWLHAVLPLGVLIDGKVNSEGFHSTVFLIAAYLLFRMERAGRSTSGISYPLALAFGLAAGLCLLTKATSAVLVVAAFGVLGLSGFRRLRASGVRSAFRRVLGPALVSGLVWAITVGWWCGPNWMKYGHPFPHPWDLEGPEQHASLAPPPLYRRPAGWALPFEWKSYLAFPILTDTEEPRPNFWAYSVTGTWSDLYNRGFCRIPGGGTTDRVWGGDHGFMSGGGPRWAVTWNCVENFSRLAWVGLPLSAIAAVSVVVTLLRALKREQGSLVFPLLATLGVGFVMAFAWKYPLDEVAVLNPRYYMPVVVPIFVCIGVWFDQLDRGRWTTTVARAVMFTATLAVTLLLAYERLCIYVPFS